MGLRALPATVLEWLVFRLRIERFGGLPPRTAPRRLVFVCTGNICRSPYAEALARSFGLNAISAGINTTPGRPANPQAIAEARARGVDLSAHRTMSWSDVRLRYGDVVIAAELRHLLAVRRRVRTVGGCQLVLMSSLSRDHFAVVRDPYGRGPAVFQEVFALIEKLVCDMRYAWSASVPQPLPFERLRHFQTVAIHSIKDLLGRILVLSRAHHRYFLGRAMIVAFHSVTDGPANKTLRCGIRDFEAYCRFFARHLRVCSMSELADCVQRGETLDGQLAITFDDGYADNAEIAAPILARYRLPATFFVATAFIDSETQTPWDTKAGIRSRWMTRQQVQALYAAGHEIGSHTQNHCDLETASEAVASAEIAGSRTDILEWTGHAPRHFAVPYGRDFPTLPRISAIVRELGFDTVTLCRGGLLEPASSAAAWERIPISPGDYLSPYGWFFDVFRGVNLGAPGS